jgi:hypothetical protein
VFCSGLAHGSGVEFLQASGAMGSPTSDMKPVRSRQSPLRLQMGRTRGPQGFSDAQIATTASGRRRLRLLDRGGTVAAARIGWALLATGKGLRRSLYRIERPSHPLDCRRWDTYPHQRLTIAENGLNPSFAFPGATSPLDQRRRRNALVNEGRNLQSAVRQRLQSGEPRSHPPRRQRKQLVRSNPPD